MRWPTRTFLIWAGAAFGGLVVLAAVAIWALLSTTTGHVMLARLITSASGGRVVLEGLAGDLPDHIVLKRLTVADDKGVWLQANDVRLDWHALALLQNRAEIADLAAGRVDVLRRPVSKSEASSSSTIVDVAHFSIWRIVLGQPVLGHAGVLRAAGRMRYASSHDLTAKLAIDRIDGPGTYRVDLAFENDRLSGTATLAEQGAGLAGGLAGLPDIGPVHLDLEADASGQANRLALQLTAGELQARLRGTANFAAKRIDADFTLTAPAMHPRPDLTWKSLTATGRVSGAFATPTIDATARIEDFSFAAAAVALIELQVAGQNGPVKLSGQLAGVRIAGDKNALAAVPVSLSAEADLSAKVVPVQFAVVHPLVSVRGRVLGDTGGRIAADLPNLAGLAPLTGLDTAGKAHFDGQFERHGHEIKASLTGTIAATGKSLAAKLLGGRGALDAVALIRGNDTILTGKLKGAALSLTLQGSRKSGITDLRAEAAFSDVSLLSSALHGKISLQAHLTGTDDALMLTAKGSGNSGLKGYARDRFDFALSASGLPAHPSGSVRLNGQLGGAPLTMEAKATPLPGGAFAVAISQARWKSASAGGDMVVSSAHPLRGAMQLQIGNLADLNELLTQKLAGRLQAKAVLMPQGNTVGATVAAQLQDFVAAATHIGHADVSGSIADVAAAPHLALKLTATGLEVNGVTGTAEAAIDGPLAALSLQTTARLVTASGPVALAAAAKADIPGGRFGIDSFKADWRGRTVALAAPATMVRQGSKANVQAAFQSGSDRLTINGAVPLSPGEVFDLHIDGHADLGPWSSFLSAEGRALQGTLTVAADLGGTTAKPVLAGSLRLQNGQYHDFTAGIALQRIEGELTAHGDTVQLSAFSAQAGGGTVNGSGTIDLGGDMPVSLSFEAKRLQPFTRDGITAILGGKVQVHGAVKTNLAVDGALRLERGDVRLPDKLPPTVAVLDVRRRHAPPPPQRPRSSITLAVQLDSPGRFFVRGRGLEAELEGALTIAGTSGRPQILGALTLRRGTYTLAGTTLEFVSGEIRFNGTAAAGKLDPALAFVAQTSANGVTAKLTVGGTLSAPKIALSSSPDLPQDEILAHLLFQQSTQQLSALQLAQIAQALVSLSRTGSGIDPVGMVRSGLGLDRLSVGSNGQTGVGSTTVEAGKYVMRNVYIGAKQNLSGGTRAQVQIDLSRHFKLQASTTAGTPATAATGAQNQDNGDTVGFSYQFDY
jgi:translocation and assembly module TamB